MTARVARSAAVLPLLAALLPAAAGMGPSFCGEVEGVTDAKTPVRPLQLICDDDTGHAKIAAITFAHSSCCASDNGTPRPFSTMAFCVSHSSLSWPMGTSALNAS